MHSFKHGVQRPHKHCTLCNTITTLSNKLDVVVAKKFVDVGKRSLKDHLSVNVFGYRLTDISYSNRVGLVEIRSSVSSVEKTFVEF